MKKIIAVCIALIITALTACGAQTPTPSDTVGEFLEATAALDGAKMSELCPENDIDVSSDSEMLKKLFGGFTYSVGESRIGGDTATVSVTITQADMAEIMTAVQAELVSVLLEHFGDDSFDSAAYGEKLVTEKLASDDKPMKDFTVEVSLKKASEDWIIAGDGNDAFFDAITGGMISYGG